MKKLLTAAAVVFCVGVIVGSDPWKSAPSQTSHHFEAALVQAHTSAQQDPDQTFPTSLHATREGKRTWYSRENGGFEMLTNIPIEQLGCLKCHPEAYADGTRVDPATYIPSCRDCHVQPGDKVKQETCLKCHRRQAIEIANYSDVHRAKGMDCMTCHTSREMHGDGTKYASWLEPGAMDVNCETCHTPLPTNVAHAVHEKTVHCTSCHAQTVVSCYNCHFESNVLAGINRPYGMMRDFALLLNRKGTNKIYSGTLMTLTYGGKSFVALAPFRAHTITKQGRACTECHNSEALREYKDTGKITLSKWDGQKLVFTKGVIPIPPDWQEALQLDFVDYKGDPRDSQTDPTKWVFLKSGADLMQMLYAEPLTEAQIRKLGR